jgi:predicted dehydrogenase
MDATSLACVGSGGERGGERGTGRPDLGIGVIGVGGRGTLARLAHKPGAGSRVVACCDVDADELARQSRRYVVDGAEPPLLTRDVAELLASERVDAVFICTPDFCHEGQAVAALEAGKAVYLEKPLAITTEGCDRILATAARRRGKLYVGHNMRHMTFVQKMRELIQSGAIGKVEAVLVRHFVGHGGDFYFKDWHADRRNTGSLLLQKGAHDIDVIHHLCGGRAVRVHAMGKLAVYGGCKRREAPADAADWRGAKASRAVENASIQNWPPASQAGLNPVVDVEDVSLMNMELDTGVLATYSQVHFTPMCVSGGGVRSRDAACAGRPSLTPPFAAVRPQVLEELCGDRTAWDAGELWRHWGGRGREAVEPAQRGIPRGRRRGVRRGRRRGGPRRVRRPHRGGLFAVCTRRRTRGRRLARGRARQRRGRRRGDGVPARRRGARRRPAAGRRRRPLLCDVTGAVKHGSSRPAGGSP